MSLSSYPAQPRAVKTSTIKTARPRSASRLRRELETRMEQQRHERAERWQAIRLGTETVDGTHPFIARLNEIVHRGALDRRGGVGYLYEGPVGTGEAAEWMHAQVSEYDGDVAVTFWPRDGRARRLLVTARGDAYVEAWTTHGPTAVFHTGKYLAAFRKIAPLRVTHGQEDK